MATGCHRVSVRCHHRRRAVELSATITVAVVRLQDACELSVKYNDLEQEKARLQQACEQLGRKNKRLEEEKTALGESAKKALEAKDAEYARALKEAREKTEKYQDLLVDNERLQKENERLLEEKKKAVSLNTELEKNFAQLSEANDHLRSQHDDDLKKIKESLEETEAYLCHHLRTTTQSLAVFCSELEAESQRVSERLRSYGPDILSTPWASARVAEEAIRLADRAQSAKKQAEEVVEAALRIDASLWPGEAFCPSVPATLDQLEKMPDRIAEWKLSSARAGVGFALALVKTHFPKAKDLERIGTGNPPGKDCTSLLSDYAATASRVASFIDLDSFVEDTQDEEENE